METTYRTVQVTLPATDMAFLRHQSRGMGWQVVAVPAKKARTAVSKAKMTEEEFRAKLAKSSAQAKAGKVTRMRDDETAEQFINRMLCM